jgi:hypothetical protein
MQYFGMARLNTKPFEVRVADRPFERGDVLLLEEWSPYTESYTGEKLVREITCVFPLKKMGIDSTYCILGTKPIF